MMHNSVETVNAAAVAIVSAESRVQQVIVPRRRWAAWFSVYWCFGSHRNSKRISHAVLVPEPAISVLNASAPENANQSPAPRLPFIAPPSSPASFLQPGSPSATQSPVGPLSLSTLSVNSYSPGGSASIFAIGPHMLMRHSWFHPLCFPLLLLNLPLLHLLHHQNLCISPPHHLQRYHLPNF